MSPSSRTARVVLNTAGNYGRFALNVAIWLILTPYIIDKLGKEAFGLWSLIFSVVGFLGLMDMGFGTGVVKFTAQSKGAGDTDGRNRIVSTIGAVLVCLALISLVLVALLAGWFNAIFHIPPEQAGTSLTLLWIISARSLFLALPLGLFRSLLFGEQRLDLINLAAGGSLVLYGLACMLALSAGMGLVAVAWISLASMLLEHALYIVLAFKKVPGLKLGISLVEGNRLKEAASFGLAASLINVASIILLRTDPVIIKLYLPLSAVALYAIALKISENTVVLTKQFVNVLAPLAAELGGSGDKEKLRFLLVNCVKFAMAPAMMLTVGSVLLGKQALVFWVGSDFAGAYPVLVILMIAVTISIPQMTAANVLVMTGGHKFAAKAAMVSVAINLAASLALVVPLGMIGVALATLLATLVVDLGVVLRRALRDHQVSLAVFARRVGSAVLVPALAQLALTWAVLRWAPPQGLFQTVLVAVPGAILYLLVFWLFFVEPSEKQLLLEKLMPSRFQKEAD